MSSETEHLTQARHNLDFLNSLRQLIQIGRRLWLFTLPSISSKRVWLDMEFTVLIMHKQY